MNRLRIEIIAHATFPVRIAPGAQRDELRRDPVHPDAQGLLDPLKHQIDIANLQDTRDLLAFDGLVLDPDGDARVTRHRFHDRPQLLLQSHRRFLAARTRSGSTRHGHIDAHVDHDGNPYGSSYSLGFTWYFAAREAGLPGSVVSSSVTCFRLVANHYLLSTNSLTTNSNVHRSHRCRWSASRFGEQSPPVRSTTYDAMAFPSRMASIKLQFADRPARSPPACESPAPIVSLTSAAYGSTHPLFCSD